MMSMVFSLVLGFCIDSVLDRYSKADVQCSSTEEGNCHTMKPTVTLQTLARVLGVSRTTVSNAFSRPDQLSDDLRGRILETAARLGYGGPNPAARTLRSGRARALGVVLTESLSYAFTDPCTVEFLSGLAAEAEASAQSLVLIPWQPGGDQTAGVRGAVVDSFCVFTLPDGHPIVDEVVARDLPAVFVDGPAVPGRPFVGIDDRAAMAEVTRHLVDLGHRSIAVLSCRFHYDRSAGAASTDAATNATFRVSRERLEGVLEAARAGGLADDAVTIYQVGRNSRDSGRVAGGKLLDGENPPTGIVCFSDQMAFGVLDALAERGLSAPNDLSVTGFDDVAAAATHGLTTVRQPSVDKGRAAGRLLLQADGGEPAVVYLDHELVVRDSTGPPRASR